MTRSLFFSSPSPTPLLLRNFTQANKKILFPPPSSTLHPKRNNPIDAMPPSHRPASLILSSSSFGSTLPREMTNGATSPTDSAHSHSSTASHNSSYSSLFLSGLRNLAEAPYPAPIHSSSRLIRRDSIPSLSSSAYPLPRNASRKSTGARLVSAATPRRQASGNRQSWIDTDVDGSDDEDKTAEGDEEGDVPMDVGTRTWAGNGKGTKRRIKLALSTFAPPTAASSSSTRTVEVLPVVHAFASTKSRRRQSLANRRRGSIVGAGSGLDVVGMGRRGSLLFAVRGDMGAEDD